MTKQLNGTYRRLHEEHFTGVRRGAGADQPWQVWYRGEIWAWRSYESDVHKVLAGIKQREGGDGGS